MKIRRRKNRAVDPKTGEISESWQLDAGIIGGKRYQRSFPTREDAESAWRKLRDTLKTEGSEAFALPAAERARMVEASQKLTAVGATIEQAVAFYLKHAVTVTESVTIEDLVTRALAAKQDEVNKGIIRPDYLGTLRVGWGSFRAGREPWPVSEITKKTVEGWLKAGGWAGKTQKNYLGDLSNLFRWAVREGLASFNPCEQVKVLTAVDETAITSLAPEQVRALFKLARSERARDGERSGDAPFSELLAYLALAVFCGVRPKELERADLHDLHLGEGVFVVDAAKAKTRQRRVVTLPPAAVAWLTLWRKLHPDAVRICPTNHERLLRAFVRRAGWKKWPHDVLRHTAATMLFACTGNEREVKIQLGHSANEETLHRHYRAVRMLNGRVVTKAAAVEFFAITPKARSRVAPKPKRQRAA
ncbi:MAG: site-specific integrase [Chthoniobacteraceae bacterium]